MSSSDWIIIPTIGENKKCSKPPASNHSLTWNKVILGPFPRHSPSFRENSQVAIIYPDQFYAFLLQWSFSFDWELDTVVYRLKYSVSSTVGCVNSNSFNINQCVQFLMADKPSKTIE